MTKRVIEREQSIMGKIFFIFKVNTVEKVLRDRDLFPITEQKYAVPAITIHSKSEIKIQQSLV